MIRNCFTIKTVKMYKRFPLKKITKSKQFYLQYISEENELLESIDFIELWGAGKPKREFLYVEDLADACVYLLKNIDAETLYDKMIILLAIL